jgi:hypothetical protein
MLFMIIERFKNGDAVPVYQRYQDRGRLVPDGLRYVSSWVDTKMQRCYQVMETDDPALIEQWTANWADLTDFEVVPVITSKEARERMARREESPPVTAFGGVTPIFRVSSLTDSVNYYVNVLGFTLDWQDPGIIASVSRDRCRIFLTEGDQGHLGTWVWIGVADVEALFDEYRRKGATIRNPPTNYQWAYEMQIEDLDNHVLRIGSEAKTGQPFGPWLDMNGDRWTQLPDGGWRVERRRLE